MIISVCGGFVNIDPSPSTPAYNRKSTDETFPGVLGENNTTIIAITDGDNKQEKSVCFVGDDIPDATISLEIISDTELKVIATGGDDLVGKAFVAVIEYK